MRISGKECFVIASLLVCCLSGCEEDAHNDKKQEEPQDGKCLELCSESPEYKCMQDGIARCEDDADGCAVWKTFEKCSKGQFCDPSSFKCVEECSEKCDPKASKKCTDKGVEICESDDNGCAVWETFKKCSEGQFCDSTSFECVEGCSEKCDPEASKKCTDKGIEICEPDENGCAVYRVEPCESGQHCDEEQLKCVSSSSPTPESCDEVCNPDALKRCTDKG